MEMRRFGLIDLALLLIVLAGAGGARYWYLSTQAENATSNPVQVQSTESNELQGLVQNLQRRGKFAGPAPLAPGEELTAHTSPGYPYLLSLAAAWTDDWQVLVRWIQLGLGTLTAGLYYLFARRAFRNEPVAFLAGLFCAFYPYWVINTAELADGVLATFLLAACIFLGARAGQEGGATASLLLGLSLAALALVRAPMLPFAFAALLWFFLRCRRMKRGWLYAVLAFLGFTNGLVPWTLRNLQVFGDAVPVVNSAYLHLWVGNHSQADGGPLDPGAIPARLKDDLLRKDPSEAAKEIERLKEMKQTARYYQLARVVVDNAMENPGATVERRLSAGLCFVFGADWFMHHALCRGDSTYEGILAASLLGMLLLAPLGWRWSYAWQASSMPSSLAVILVPVPYILSHGEALSGPRLPLDGVLLCYAALAVVCLLPGIGPYLRVGYDDRKK
jgi:4-amino-4-deoxy-L-arabinose transferase-like glycosyltransferase